jgi:long-subunit fatty acid transport protein
MILHAIDYIKPIKWPQILPQGYYKSRKILISLMIFLFLVCATDVYGQSQENVVNQQLWIDIFPHFSVNEKLEYYGDAGYRTIVNDSWNRIHLRPSLRYKLNKSWEIHGGLGFFYTFDSSDTNQFEFRPWQAIQLNWPKTAHLSIKHLVRIEERLSYTTNNWESSFDLRFRYKLSGKVVPCVSCGLHNIFIPFYGEMFLPVNDNIVEFYRNRGRAGIGLGYNASKDWRFSLIMNWQKSRAGAEDEFHVTDYIYHLKIFKRWESGLLRN